MQVTFSLLLRHNTHGYDCWVVSLRKGNYTMVLAGHCKVESRNSQSTSFDYLMYFGRCVYIGLNAVSIAYILYSKSRGVSRVKNNSSCKLKCSKDGFSTFIPAVLSGNSRAYLAGIELLTSSNVLLFQQIWSSSRLDVESGEDYKLQQLCRFLSYY